MFPPADPLAVAVPIEALDLDIDPFADFDPGPLMATADTWGAALPARAPSHSTTRGAVDPADFDHIEEFKRRELARIEREARQARERAAEVRRRHHGRTLGARRAQPRGPSRERRPGPCRAKGSRRASARRSTCARNGDPPDESDSAGLSPLPQGAGR